MFPINFPSEYNCYNDKTFYGNNIEIARKLEHIGILSIIHSVIIHFANKFTAEKYFFNFQDIDLALLLTF